MKLRVTPRALLATLLVIAACSSGERGGGAEPTSSPSTEPTPTGDPSASAETEPSPTGTGSAELTLRVDGLGEFAFGVDAAPALAAASAHFGVPDQDDTIVFQGTDSPGVWTNGSTGFAHEFGRTTCWSAVLCLYFGGASLDGLQFVGWWYYDAAGTGAVSLSTADGIRPWSVLSDHLDSISVADNTACYTEINGSTTDGLEVSMRSVGEPFFTYDTNGVLIEGHPSPEDVVIVGLAAGDRVAEQDADC